MVKRIFNFSAGPCVLPLSALEIAQKEFLNFQDTGMSIIEMSHREKQYDKVHHDAFNILRELLSIPENFDILFVQGGATQQFAMVPMNLLKPGTTAEYVHTGSWAKSAISDAKKIGSVNIIWNGEAEKFTRIPKQEELKMSGNAAYVHVTSNETIGGIEFQKLPDTGKVPLVADMSSHIMSRPVDFSKVALVYAGAQKNLGPAGCAVVIIRKDLLAACNENLPVYLSYNTHASKESLHNTPPVFAIYMMKLTLDWVKSIGGLKGVENLAIKRSKIIYDTIDQSNGWYRCPVDTASRSRMNVCFRLPTEDLEKKFIAESLAADMSNLKGHRSVGGCRASMYNAMPVEGAEVLAAFMKDFQKKNS